MFLSYAISHYFFPGYSNNQKAKLLHTTTLSLFIVFLIIFQIILQFLPVTGVKILGYAADIPPETVISLTNEKRKESGLSELTYDSSLASAALAKGNDMIQKGYWAHVAPDGTEPWDFFVDSGYKYKYAGENLARDFSNPQAAVDAWMASPSHRENLLSSKYQEIGVAVVEGDLAGIDTTIIVQLFGTRYSEALPQMPVASAINNEKPNEIVVVPTTIPTVTPFNKPLPTGAQVAPVSLTYQPNTLISPFATTKGISLVMIMMLLSVLVIDGILTSRRKITRIGGRTFAHLAFLGMILAIALIAKAGSIL